MEPEETKWFEFESARQFAFEIFTGALDWVGDKIIPDFDIVLDDDDD